MHIQAEGTRSFLFEQANEAIPVNHSATILLNCSVSRKGKTCEKRLLPPPFRKTDELKDCSLLRESLLDKFKSP
jgi:hypothetical protein